MKKGVVISRHSSQIHSKQFSCAFFLSSLCKTPAETYPGKISKLSNPAPVIDTIFTSEGNTDLKKVDVFPRDILYWPLEKNVAHEI